MSSDIFIHRNISPPVTMADAPLCGKRVVIQPNMSAREWLTDAGSPALKGFIALEDATVIARLQNAGAHLVGSTRMSELGFGLNGDCSTRALVDGDADVALITDTMGESRMAAAMSGFCGFKPSYGIVSRFGLIGLVPSMECFGIMSKTPLEIASVLNVVAGHDDRDFSMSEEELPHVPVTEAEINPRGSIGVIGESLQLLKEEEVGVFRERLQRLADRGMEIRDISLPDFDLLPAIHNVIGSVEASSSGGKYDGVRYGHRSSGAKNWNEMYLKSRGESFGHLIKTYLLQGAYFQFENFTAFENACRIRSRLFQQTQRLFEQVDFLVLPTRRHDFPVDKASTINSVYETFFLSILPNITGLPAIHLSDSVTGQPIDPGLQIVGKRLDDLRLLYTAAHLQSPGKGMN
jgi:aspartyl-tRNA(Asn)/glutamyl-tRNA(Gln) amidotransferase subunit A